VRSFDVGAKSDSEAWTLTDTIIIPKKKWVEDENRETVSKQNKYGEKIRREEGMG
jgi:hypothetical protein